jgi:nitrite reductase/ring-hydroxylating ferredoxin subunit/uncharacterized membrane protein
MRSRAHFKAHPIHPALIPFPFAFLIGAVLFDVVAVLRTDPAMWTTAGHLTLAGIGAGLLAAVPGAVDYVYSVPPDSSGKQRATKHAGGNVLALMLFGAAFAARGDDWAPGWATLGLELLGGATLAYSGWLGGTLVTRNLISVDHRYARAGKWQEGALSGRAGEPLIVGHLDDLKEDQMKLLHVNGHRIVLARLRSGYCAFEDRCSHRGGSLAAGVLIDGTVQCLWHGSQFDVTRGTVTCGPATTPIRVYAVQQKPDGGVVLVSPPG